MSSRNWQLLGLAVLVIVAIVVCIFAVGQSSGMTLNWWNIS
jgi:hypothetical protein